MKKKFSPIPCILLMMLTAACHTATKTDKLTLSGGGLRAEFCTCGARLMHLQVPDKQGKMTNVVWGFDNARDYAKATKDPYYGAIIGRYGNRIGGAMFRLNGKTYTLDKNDHGNSLHGGKDGFHNQVWNVDSKTDSSVTFSYASPDGQGGYPGALQVKVTYTLTSDHALQIHYEATADKATVINLTNHAYWNLNGPGSGTILQHQLQINAAKYLGVDSLLIPKGKPKSVTATPFDFRQPKAIGKDIALPNAQLRNGKGYDHNFILDQPGFTLPAAIATGDQSGIRMEVFTDQPGLQFYSGNFMAGKNRMNAGQPDNFRSGFCLETQHFPDSPNQPA